MRGEVRVRASVKEGRKCTPSAPRAPSVPSVPSVPSGRTLRFWNGFHVVGRRWKSLTLVSDSPKLSPLTLYVLKLM